MSQVLKKYHGRLGMITTEMVEKKISNSSKFDKIPITLKNDQISPAKEKELKRGR